MRKFLRQCDNLLGLDSAYFFWLLIILLIGANAASFVFIRKPPHQPPKRLELRRHFHPMVASTAEGKRWTVQYSRHNMTIFFLFLPGAKVTEDMAVYWNAMFEAVKNRQDVQVIGVSYRAGFEDLVKNGVLKFPIVSIPQDQLDDNGLKFSPLTVIVDRNGAPQKAWITNLLREEEQRVAEELLGFRFSSSVGRSGP